MPIQVDRRKLQVVFTLSFLARHEHVLFVGPVGVGKTFLAQALGVAAVRAGHSVLFTRADALFKDLVQARVDHTFERVFRRYLTPDLLIVDDFGRAPRGAVIPRRSRDPPLAAAAVGRS